MRSFVELLFETLCRRGELMALRFEDINFLDKTALIRITKNGKPRKIGLSVRAIEIIKSIPRNVSGNCLLLTEQIGLKNALSELLQKPI